MDRKRDDVSWVHVVLWASIGPCKRLLTCLCHSHFLQAAEEVAKHLQAMKAMLYGSGDQEPQTEVVAQLAQELYSSDMLLQLVDNLHRLDFEVRCTGEGRGGEGGGCMEA